MYLLIMNGENVMQPEIQPVVRRRTAVAGEPHPTRTIAGAALAPLVILTYYAITL
jgi:hypothetical protein